MTTGSSQLPEDSEYLQARDEIVRKYLWGPRTGPTLTEQVLSYVAPKAVQGRVQMRALRAAPSHLHAVGIGTKNETAEKAVVVYVTRKLSRADLPQSDIVPPSIDGLPTDVVESRMARFAACTDQRRMRNRPLIGGISVGRSGGPTGTLGAFVRSTRAGDPEDAVYLLSNSHVLFSGTGRVEGVRVVQPSADDGAGDGVAVLARATTLAIGKLLTADAAIARVDTATTPVTNEICDIGAVAAAVPPAKDMIVEKHGRTTGRTAGIVKVTGLATEVLDEHARRLRFVNAIRVEPNGNQNVAGLGDSGSLVVRQSDRAAVGLLYAADERGQFYLAQPIADVCRELEIALLVD